MSKPYQVPPPADQIPAADKERFFGYVQKHDGHPDGCHVWTGSKTSAGHGLFRVRRDSMELEPDPGQSPYVTFAAHRVAWVLHHGGPPEFGRDVYLSPYCTSKTCVNPLHLKTWPNDSGSRLYGLTPHGRKVLVSAAAHKLPYETITKAFRIPESSVDQYLVNYNRDCSPWTPYPVEYVVKCLEAYRTDTLQPHLPPNSDEITLADCL